MFIINNNGIDNHSFVKKIIIQDIFVYPIMGCIYYVMYLSCKDMPHGTVFFYVVLLPIMILLITTSIFFILKFIGRNNKTIKAIDVTNNTIIASTFPVFWLKSEEYSLLKSEINYKKSIFQWYGKDKKEGITITTISGIELFLVKDFFNEYDVILNNLNMQ